jgi:UDP-N-acetylmuramoyl-tripeptide--D-alanyl-D-alanine ligase
VLDDSYNANPASLEAALSVLAEQSGARILVLGDMAELGADESRLHRDAGARARAAGIERLLAVGPLSREAVAAFGPGASHFDTHEALIDALRPLLRADVTVLVKGSRCMHMETVTQAVCEPAGSRPGGEGAPC